jgi:predicted dehydrogenase
VLLVGAGAMGRRWAETISTRRDLVLSGWVDVVADVAESAVAELGLRDVAVDDDLARALATGAPDFVVDVAVPEAHFDVTLAALRHGVPVLGEKPMAVTLDEANRLIEASEQAGKLFMVSQSRRYNRQLAALKGLVDGVLGEPEIVSCQFYKAPHFGGFRDEMPSPLLADMAIHHFDAARWLVGRDPLAVYCEEYNPSWSWYRGAACATAIFEFQGGARLTYAGSWCAEGEETSWEGSWRIVTANGTARWDGVTDPHAELVGPDGDADPAPGAVADDFSESISGSLAEFVSALDDGHLPMGECHDNIKSLAMSLAASTSSAEGRRVPVTWV